MAKCHAIQGQSLYDKSSGVQVPEMTNRFAFLKLIFHTSECIQSNENKKRQQNSMARCAEGVR